MVDFFHKLFDTSDFPARWSCGNWDAFHGWLHIGSDIAIWAAYFMIPIALGYYWWSKRSELMFPRLFWLFAAFIFFCGTTHLIEAVLFYKPVYRFSGLMKFVTAGVSWMTVIAIIRVGRTALELPGLARMSRDLQQQLDNALRIEKHLEASNNELVEYTTRVTHDLRNPLSGVLLLGDLAMESTRNGETELAAEQLESMLASLREMDHSMEELHRHSLVEKGRRKRSRVRLDDVMETVRNNMAGRVRESGASLTAAPLPEVIGNRILLIHLFTNLLDNAIKYRNSGRPEIVIEARRDDVHEIITITDNGCGVPAADCERIFEPEGRAANVLDRTGSGVGLALCRSIMAGHSGSIRVLPGVEHGSVFELRFPRAAPHDQQARMLQPGGACASD